jgi:arylsulfatase A-like enzyme
MTMMTGLEPCAHGLVEVRDSPLAAERPTLAEALRAAGWTTAAVTEDAYVIATNGFDRGFDVYVENRSEESASPGFAAETFGAATDWLRAHAREPFFLFVHTYQVHAPYVPPRGYATLFGDDPADQNGRDLLNYEREIRYTDDLLADFLDGLDASGLADRTIVVATSDHGEGFGEHFWTGHGWDLHDEAILVPLAVRAPGLVPPGTVVEEQVGLVDLAPTVLDLLGQPPLPEVQGRSFARLLTGRGAAFEERPVVSRALSLEGPGAAKFAESARTRQWKYVAAPGLEVVHDLSADPGEQVAARNPEALEAGRRALREAHAACEAWRKAHPAAAAKPVVENAPDWMLNREETERKLRSLGYVQ